ncbi:MAG: hypothetical protein ACLRYY_12410 [Anaerobutyricum soehngenii]
MNERYRGQQGLCYRASCRKGMVDVPGYASMVNWFRSVGEIPYPDFDDNRRTKMPNERNGTGLHS